jgi:hypothetical protein
MRKSGFTQYLVQQNNLDRQNFFRWAFRPGMGFGETEKWWDIGKRPTPHEGLDLCFFNDPSGTLRHLCGGDRIPAIYDGTVKGVIKDFLGHTVVVAHDIFDSHGKPLLTLYAHTIPDSNLRINNSVKEGNIIAHIADSDKMPPGMISHIHISAGRMNTGFTHDQLDWGNISGRAAMTLTDPLEIIDPFKINKEQ